MDLSFTEEQEILRKFAGDFLTGKFPKKVVKELEEGETGYSPEIWKEMAELGWLGLPFPEKYGGAGMTFLDLAVLLEEMGKVCMPGPYFSTVLLGGFPILDAGTEEQKQSHLTKVTAGDEILTLALNEPGGSNDAGDQHHPFRRSRAFSAQDGIPAPCLVASSGRIPSTRHSSSSSSPAPTLPRGADLSRTTTSGKSSARCTSCAAVRSTDSTSSVWRIRVANSPTNCSRAAFSCAAS